ncbi:unnamed protein product [Heterosigma akashiwo]
MSSSSTAAPRAPYRSSICAQNQGKRTRRHASSAFRKYFRCTCGADLAISSSVGIFTSRMLCWIRMHSESFSSWVVIEDGSCSNCSLKCRFISARLAPPLMRR